MKERRRKKGKKHERDERIMEYENRRCEKRLMDKNNETKYRKKVMGKNNAKRKSNKRRMNMIDK